MKDPLLSSALFEFMNERWASKDKGQEISMTRAKRTAGGSWYISDEDYPKFFDLLHQHLFVQRNLPIVLVEQRRPDGITPLLLDLDFAYSPDKALTHAFTTEQIQNFVKEVGDVLVEYFDTKKHLVLKFFVMLRPQAYNEKSKNINKDGIHIMCTDFSLTPEDQASLRLLILKRGIVGRCFAGTENLKSDEDTLDKALMKKGGAGWFFYGESKQDIPAYSLTQVYKYTPRNQSIKADSLDGYADPRQLMEMLSIRYHLKPTLTIRETKREEVAALVEAPKTPVQKPLTGEEIDTIQLENAWQNHFLMQNIAPESQIKLAKRLALECLSQSRADDYTTWMEVGWCLRNIDSSEEMFNIWMEFSAKSPKFSHTSVDQLRRDWTRGAMRSCEGRRLLTMGSLRRWARMDNQEKYQAILKDDIINYIQKVGLCHKGGTHHHVASIMHMLFNDQYRCNVENRSTEWYAFKEHIWNTVPQGIEVKTRIHKEVAEYVCEARQCLPGIKDPTEEDLKKEMENRMKLLKMEENLYSANFKDSVMKEAIQLFYDDNFAKKMNQNPYTLGCGNGVLHLREIVRNEKGEAIGYKPTLMPGQPEDYISYRVGETPDGNEALDYEPYDPEDPQQIELMDFFTKLFPEEELREYVLTLAAGCLEGANKEQCFYIMTGSGGNGKSKFVELMCSVLGNYASSLSTTALTRKRPDSGAANPDIISIKGCRFIEMKEPDEREPINSARMKQFSGEDLVEARGLFKDQEKFKVTGKIFMACNRLPPIHSMDGGTWRRIRVIPFNSRFVTKSDPALDPSRHIYPRDDMLDEKLKSWRQPFFALLVHYYETKYCPHGIQKVPSVVLATSEEYKGSYDSFQKFLKARIRRVIGYEHPPVFKHMYSAYRLWHNDQSGIGKKLTENEFKIRLNETYQAPADGKTYLHLRLFDTDEDVEEFDASPETS